MRRPQRGFVFTAFLMPFVVALLAWPLVAHLYTLKARQAVLDAEVAVMLKRKPPPVRDLHLEAEVEVLQTLRF